MGVLDDATGALRPIVDPLGLTHGPLDSVGRQFDDTAGGGFVEVGDNTTDETESVLGVDPWGESQENPLLEFGPARTLYDVTFSYDETLNGTTDSTDVVGPTVGGVVDAVVQVDGEAVGAEERKARTLLLLVGAAVALYLLAPLLEVGAALLGGDEE